ncbi:MAG: M20/M25/M40 family metallo-hydrolase [Acidobacteria bacterium]|nr:M20/M25/M40 family metallo-hydrolase [Acidobacteriota bacterium]
MPFSRAKTLFVFALALLIAFPAPLFSFAGGSNDTLDYQTITLIRNEGFKDSHVMEIMSELSDRIGPRLTGSPNMKRANDWTRDQLAAWGLQNAHLEPWGPFGRGWAQEYVSVRMTSPDVSPLFAIPMAWTPGTNGVVHGPVVIARIQSVDDLAKYHGKLEGAVVLYGNAPDVRPHDEAQMHRYDDKGLQEVAGYEVPGARPRNVNAPQFNPDEARRRRELGVQLRKFWADEKVLAVITPGRGDGGTIFVQSGGGYKPGEEGLVPMLAMAAEHYGRLYRLANRDVPVDVELDVRTKFTDDGATQYNTVAEIPGTDPKLKDEVVMLGGHLDSWHGGTGATDNGAGVGVMMEAVRILKALDVHPRRTIRIALWSGEEEGLIGSCEYVRQHFGTRSPDNDTCLNRAPGGPGMQNAALKPLVLKPEQQKVSVYFNVDNGTGRIRGVYTQENAAAVPIFAQWFEPFHDLDAQTISMRNTGGTDHLSFDGVGIPGFQFIQDPVEYDTRTHHSNMDVYERLQPADMMQNAVIVAAFVYQAAMRDQMFPRKPLPKDTMAPKTDSNKAFIPLEGQGRPGGTF